jgi:hypothetical protein
MIANDEKDKLIIESLTKINGEINELNIKENKTNDDYNHLTKLYFNQLLKGMQLSNNFNKI